MVSKLLPANASGTSMVFRLRRSGFQNADEHFPAVTFRLCIRQDLNLQPSDPKILDEEIRQLANER
jgi:hypothetical protein